MFVKLKKWANKLAEQLWRNQAGHSLPRTPSTPQTTLGTDVVPA